MMSDQKIYSMEAAQRAARFVKYILPYGANNREVNSADQKIAYHDKFKRYHKATIDKVDQVFLNVHNRIKSQIGDSFVDSVDKIKIVAEAAIKYGAGNCEQQAAVAFMYLVSQGIYKVTRVAVQVWVKGIYCNNNGHVFLEFLNSDGQLVSLDTWDDNSVYVLGDPTLRVVTPNMFYKRDDTGAECHPNHVGIRKNPDQFRVSMYEVLPGDAVQNEFRQLLKSYIFNAQNITHFEKQIACKQLGIPLSEALRDYKAMRSKEWAFGFYGSSRANKFGAIDKLVQLLGGDSRVIFLEAEIAALADSRLGDIINAYRDCLPSIYLEAEKKYLLKIKSNQAVNHGLRHFYRH